MKQFTQKTFEKIFKEHLKIESYSKSIDSLFSPRLKNRIDYKPYYQRNYVWDKNKATYFIESIFLGTEIPPLIFFDNNDKIEIIDGRQRFETILRFMEGKLSLTSKGLGVLKNLSKQTWEKLAKNDMELIENFLDAKLRIIEFRLVNEPPLDKILEDKVKKEIFARYNTGITPLRKAEIDNAIYDNDELTNSFKKLFDEKPNLKSLIYKTFFKQKKSVDEDNIPTSDVLSFVRRYLVLPKFPIAYYARGTGRTEILSKLYELFADENIDNHKVVIDSFIDKIEYVSEILRFSKEQNLQTNRLAMECIMWGLGILELEEIKYETDQKSINDLANYIDKNIADFTMQDYGFQEELITRHLSIAGYFEEKYKVDLSLYATYNKDAQTKVKKLRKSNVTNEKILELEKHRLNKPEPSRNSIDDIARSMMRRRFMVRPSYQRKEVINPKKASSIIESILLGISLPSLFIFKRENGIREVIDGQQRLLTLLGFIGTEYIDEKGKTSVSKNHLFKLRNLKILHEYSGRKFSELPDVMQTKILDFQLYIVEIDSSQNPDFDPIDLFIRLNDKPFPIREHSFEMWNSWADVEVIEGIKKLRESCKSWFYVRQLKRESDRDRMENEELLMAISVLAYQYLTDSELKSLDIYQKTGRINARIKNKGAITSLLEEINHSQDIKQKFFKSIKEVKSFIKKVKYIILDKDKKSDEIGLYLKNELDRLFKGGKEAKYFKRTMQDFYILWSYIYDLNFEMVKYHRLDMKNYIYESFRQLKNIPEEEWTENKGYKKFQKRLLTFKEKYKKDARKIRLNEDEKLDMIKKQNNKSSITGAPIFLGDEIEVDHIEALAIGGKDEMKNLGIAHKIENREKGTK